MVVEQSYANLAQGGKYHHLLGPSRVSTLAQYDAQDVVDSDQALVFFATVGTFNQKDKEKGDRLLFKSDIDTAESSTWNALKGRPNRDGIRRPLLVVYDEGHNLSDQQTDLLVELQPDALIVACATMKRPARVVDELNQLKAEGWTEDDLITVVDPKAVAESGLVKSTVLLGGYQAPMEETIDAMIADLRVVEAEAQAAGIGPLKAIYVSKTNIVEGNSLQRDDPKQPFKHRKAPPILIWRHLTEQCGVDPDHIAVYCSLKFDKSHPAPDGFRLFSGGDKDYEAFVSGPFRHVIFNLSLQEGWDDPLCYFAYIDKSMESNVQVEQVIGRLLRQPGGQHYHSEALNSAHFYVRVDKRGVFNELLAEVGRKLGTEAPGVIDLVGGLGRSGPRGFLIMLPVLPGFYIFGVLLYLPYGIVLRDGRLSVGVRGVPRVGRVWRCLDVPLDAVIRWDVGPPQAPERPASRTGSRRRGRVSTPASTRNLRGPGVTHVLRLWTDVTRFQSDFPSTIMVGYMVTNAAAAGYRETGLVQIGTRRPRKLTRALETALPGRRAGAPAGSGEFGDRSKRALDN